MVVSQERVTPNQNQKKELKKSGFDSENTNRDYAGTAILKKQSCPIISKRGFLDLAHSI